MSSGLYAELVKRRLLVSHEEEISQQAALIKPEKVPFISYPYEWSFTMLKDAAMATLRIQKLALKHGLILKDASGFNIQFLRGRPLLIDTLSFAKYEEGKPWIAYSQFCRHFLAPLLLSAHVDVRLSRLSLLHLDGIPLDLAASLAPLRAKLDPAFFVHILPQARLDKNSSEYRIPIVQRQALLAIIDNLEDSIRRLKPKMTGDKKAWSDYYQTCSYVEEDMQVKAAKIDAFIQCVQPKTIFDVGANTGKFSRIGADKCIDTVAMDVDALCVDAMYKQCTADGVEHLLPLVIDLCNPTPAAGWALVERDSLLQRGPADMVLALALIHHLAIANNVPLPYISEMFASLGRWLVIEFVPKSDVQVAHMLKRREDIFPNYDVEAFLSDFEHNFELVERAPLPGCQRELFLMRSRVF